MIMHRFCVLLCLFAVFVGHAPRTWATGSCEGGDDKLKLLGVAPKKGVVVFTGSSKQCETVCQSDGCDGDTVTRQVTLFHEFNGNLRPPGLDIHGWADSGGSAESDPERIAKQVVQRHVERLATERQVLQALGSLTKLEECQGPPPGMLDSAGECEDHAHTLVLSVSAAKEKNLAVCFESPTAVGKPAP
jgi:hypothetical protein